MKFLGEKKEHVTHRCCQIRVWRLFGFIPILLKRRSTTSNIGREWVWGYWRPAGFFDVWHVNGLLIEHEEKIREFRESV